LNQIQERFLSDISKAKCKSEEPDKKN